MRLLQKIYLFIFMLCMVSLLNAQDTIPINKSAKRMFTAQAVRVKIPVGPQSKPITVDQIFSVKVINGDTIYVQTLPTAYVFAPPKFKTKREAKQWNRMVRYLKKVYPYAQRAGQLLKEYNDTLATAKNERSRRRIMKKAEDQLKEEYEDDIRNMTRTQGRYLLLLIDRETSHSSYELVQELRGKLMAGFWQGFGRLFGVNLKERYQPKGKHWKIELIVKMIEVGAI